uniref:uncharacterized protein LOC124054085 n=1 Tax=Scatophagus argus TaxID=75038 RepID=UPI001ED844E8|nr:uncharacterized protein LOC124054085 [Scatophagus argus]
MKVTTTLSSAKVPPSNISTEERKALISLQKDQDIMILSADKGRCTVILNTQDYHSKVATLLSDTATSEKLKRNPTSNYKQQLISYLQKLEKDQLINRKLYFQLYPGEATPCLYGLPKIHKEGVPLRPIVSSINSVTYKVAKHLAHILAPLVGHSPHHIHNSQDFVNKVKEIIMDPDDTMVSFDVTSLFTCIPTSEATQMV